MKTKRVCLFSLFRRKSANEALSLLMIISSTKLQSAPLTKGFTNGKKVHLKLFLKKKNNGPGNSAECVGDDHYYTSAQLGAGINLGPVQGN